MLRKIQWTAFALLWATMLTTVAAQSPQAPQAEKRIMEGLQRAAQVAYYPSLNQLWVQFDFGRRQVRFREAVELKDRLTQVRLDVVEVEGGHVVASTTWSMPDHAGRDLSLDLPPLKGRYELRFVFSEDGRDYTTTQELVREHYPWEGNTLGISDEVPRPFTPVEVAGRDVKVVLRDYQMNGYGLFDAVTAGGRELLARPMALRYELADGTEGEWATQTVELVEHGEKAAVFRTQAEAPAIAIGTQTRIEFDGVARVEMTLKPGASPQEVDRLWVEIPLRDAEVPLMNTYVDGPRINYAGHVPAGEGVVWTSKDAPRYLRWQNTFCPYLWLGAEGPGLAWFGENDRGYRTAKGGSDLPIQELRREDGELILRVYLINQAVTVQEPSTLVFGLQATPTKPMPEDWRTVEVKKHSGPVVPWGGLCCSYKFPYKDDWSVVDKILESRETNEVDSEWFEAWAEANNPPMIFGTVDWVKRQLMFAERTREKDGRPLVVYHEEMRATPLRPEWATFASEWGAERYADREMVSMDIMRRGFNVSPGKKISFPDSYIDYGVYYANEWLKRGVGLYWDNTYPQAGTDPRMSAAYVTEDGQIQPATGFWQQRRYHQRIWNLLVYWQDHQDQPLQWSNHVTNGRLAPLHTYGTTFLALEWRGVEPFDPALIRTEMIGWQVGCIPTALDELYGQENPVVKDLSSEQKWRIRWGMEAVHEIRAEPWEERGPRTPGDRPVREAFGYGTPAVKVHHYWDREPAATVSHEDVYWLLLERPEDQASMVILSSWSAEDVQTTVRLEDGASAWRDAETGESLPRDADGGVTVDLPGPYGVRVLTTGTWQEAQ